MILPTKKLEKRLFKSGYRLIYAVDEVGVGSLAGPVVVCAVAMTSQFYNKVHKKLSRVRDSKLLQAKQREKFSEELLKQKDLVYALAQSNSTIIDKLNIHNAALLAMKKAVHKLKPSLELRNIVLIDGRAKIKGLKNEQMAIVKGDRKVFAIACASIIAKVHRDRLMTRYAKKYPGYGFDKHKGYGTKYHQAKLASLGPCEIHRRSFAPVSELL